MPKNKELKLASPTTANVETVEDNHSYYQLAIDIGGTRLRWVDELLQVLRGYGAVDLDLATRQAIVTFEIAENGIPDLWDLRSVVQDMYQAIDEYFDSPPMRMKPVLVGKTAEGRTLARAAQSLARTLSASLESQVRSALDAKDDGDPQTD